MLTDAHCHPFDLAVHFPAAENERRRLGVMCAASASAAEEFSFCEELSRSARTDNAAALLPCFAVHPQMPLMERLSLLDTLAGQGRLAAVGETGFDLYNDVFRAAEKTQNTLFSGHLAAALRYDLPLVIHSRRAMHKIFAYTAALKKCRAVIFHSWPGTQGEGGALLRRGINAFFSFGTTIMLNHREAMRCCALFPADRLLTETDAPFQPLRGKQFSAYGDLVLILRAMAALRHEDGLEKIIETNFMNAFLAGSAVSARNGSTEAVHLPAMTQSQPE